jgi:predicted small lipoprotein YifL
LLAGCGAKGPLILPQKVVPIEVPTETAPEAAAEAAPESVPPEDGAGTEATSNEPEAGDATETPVPPTKDD